MTDQQPEALLLAALIEADMPCDGSEIAAELRRLHAELNEQCRLLGMSSEREARHLAVMQQALEALEIADKHCPVSSEAEVLVRLSITALNAQLKDKQ